MHTVEMGSGAMIYIPGFTVIGYDIQTFLYRGYIDTRRQEGDCE
jgi:hypothetical protein